MIAVYNTYSSEQAIEFDIHVSMYGLYLTFDISIQNFPSMTALSLFMA
jgi:hypothetical protein